MDSRESDDESSSGSTQESQPRTARKSTTGKSAVYVTRRQAAKNASKAIFESSSGSRKLASAFEKSMENFNPDLSNRERRKISKKFSVQHNSTRRPIGALYNEVGTHLASGLDLCDCLRERCAGCWFECPKCGSQKCGPDCRVHRKFLVESIEYHGYDKVVRCPIK